MKIEKMKIEKKRNAKKLRWRKPPFLLQQGTLLGERKLLIICFEELISSFFFLPCIVVTFVGNEE